MRHKAIIFSWWSLDTTLIEAARNMHDLAFGTLILSVLVLGFAFGLAPVGLVVGLFLIGLAYLSGSPSLHGRHERHSSQH
jgi:hypothetical protein